MRRLITVWAKSNYSSFYLTVSNGQVSGTVTVCAVDGVSHYVVFCFNLYRDWEHRVVTWLVNMWCCMLSDSVPLGLSCDTLPQLGGLFRSTTGLGSIDLKPLLLADLSRTIVEVSGRVLGDTDMHVVLNHLQKRLKGFIKDPLLLGCPHLLQVWKYCSFVRRYTRLVFNLFS